MSKKKSKPIEEHVGSPGKIGTSVWLLTALFVCGLVSLVYGLNSKVDQPDIRLFTVSYLYLMGVSQSGVVFCAITRLVRAEWAKPYYRFAELTTLAFIPFAFLGFFLIYFGGKEVLFYWLTESQEGHGSSWLNIHWLFVRDVLGLLLFYGVSWVYVFKGLGPDLLVEKNKTGINHRDLEDKLYWLSPIVILCFVVCNTLFAWDFGMMLIPHWHSTVFPIYFWFGSLFAGSSALIVFPALRGFWEEKGAHFGPGQIRGLAMLVTAFTLMWLYFFWSQFFVIWFGNLPHETEPLWKQMYGHYAPYFWVMMAGCFFIPFTALLFAVVKRSLLAMCLIGFGINLGVWLSRYLMVMPVYSINNTPFEHWIDLSLSVGLLAGFLVAVALLASRFPMYSYWEINRQPKTK